MASGQIVAQVLVEVAQQDRRHPDGFPGDRNGIRAGIAAIEDEAREALEAWHSEKSLAGNREEQHQWTNTREELVQVAAVVLRTLRELPRPCNCLERLGGPGHEDGCPAAYADETERQMLTAALTEEPHTDE